MRHQTAFCRSLAQHHNRDIAIGTAHLLLRFSHVDWYSCIWFYSILSHARFDHWSQDTDHKNPPLLGFYNHAHSFLPRPLPGSCKILGSRKSPRPISQFTARKRLRTPDLVQVKQWWAKTVLSPLSDFIYDITKINAASPALIAQSPPFQVS